MANPAYEGNIYCLAVEVTVKIEQEHLKQRRAVIEHRPPAEACNPVITRAGDIDAHCIDPMLEPARRIELKVGAAEPERARALPEMNALREHEPGRARKFGRFHHPAGCKRIAHSAG